MLTLLKFKLEKSTQNNLEWAIVQDCCILVKFKTGVLALGSPERMSRLHMFLGQSLKRKL